MTIILLCVIGVIITVEYWSHTEAGKVPVKTGVLLHAVDQRIVTSGMKVPKIFTGSGESRFDRKDMTIPMSDGAKIPVRIYQPKAEGPHPIILYYHGGAFLEGYGNIQTHDNIVRALASKTNSVVISVGYRLAPTYPFPTATEDSYEALAWAKKHADLIDGDSSKLAVVGDSAGGNLATVVTMMARDRNGPKITAQALLYPLTTFQDVSFPSRQTYDSGYYFISRSVMEKARENYTPDEKMWSNPYTSPLDANLNNLPPAFIITAEFDPLRDEGEAYGKRLADYNIPVTATRYNGVMHGFVSLYEVMHRGKQALDETATFLNTAFWEQPTYQSYNFTINEEQSTMEKLQDRGEAYAIGAFLIGKQAFSLMTSW
ncbi:alpha/beta hydrolase [Metabacillus halosaccharovorans]|uniref:alpha/beta hydrolase n=1 Tax=Metabacillus halosaccharovorans TaxID=930124 RepID=UPI001FECC31E|nr:alpha/beta hydrolase [Metabacillus halosaccharovorans]